MSATGDKEPTEHGYFQAIEEKFVELNGAFLFLSPEDFQLVRSWQRDGIPLDLVLRGMDEVVTQRKKRGMRDRISSLRYFRSAVETAWQEHHSLDPGCG